MFQFIYNLLFRKNKINTGGCVDEVDSRNFGAEVLAGQVTKEDLVFKNFKTCNISVLIHQSWTDFCVGCSGAYSKEGSEKKGMMSWVGAYALACKVIGYIPEYGMSILAMMKARVKYGIPEYEYYPFYKNKTKAKMANWKNLSPSAIANAYDHRDESFFMINPPRGWDKFDTFRAYLKRLKDKEVVINTGADAHAISLNEQKIINGELRIGGPDSYGEKGLKYRLGITINGYRYFNKHEVNQFFSGYIGSDMERKLAELLNEYNGKAIKLADNSTCYLVKNGKKHELPNEFVAWSHNTLLFNPSFVYEVNKEELNKIPTGKVAEFKEGENWEIVQRMFEKIRGMSPEGIDRVLQELNNQ